MFSSNYLFILVPPRIIAHSPEHMHLTIREGHNARFSCTASGRPTPVILWHVNGLSRPATVTTRMSKVLKERKLTSCHTSIFIYLVTGKNASILILRNVTRFDSGRVDCSASNTLSTVNRQFLLHVKCMFKFFFFLLIQHPDYK